MTPPSYRRRGASCSSGSFVLAPKHNNTTINGNDGDTGNLINVATMATPIMTTTTPLTALPAAKA